MDEQNNRLNDIPLPCGGDFANHAGNLRQVYFGKVMALIDSGETQKDTKIDPSQSNISTGCTHGSGQVCAPLSHRWCLLMDPLSHQRGGCGIARLSRVIERH